MKGKVIAGYYVEAVRDKVRRLVEENPGATEFLIDEIAPGWLGVHQLEEVIDYFGLDVDPEDEFAWEEVELRLDKIATKLTRGVNLPGVVFCFGTWEGDGAYGLIAIVEKDEALAQG